MGPTQEGVYEFVTNAEPVVGTAAVAEEFVCSIQTARRRLKKLEDADVVESRAINDRTTVWYTKDNDVATASIDDVGPERLAEVMIDGETHYADGHEYSHVMVGDPDTGFWVLYGRNEGFIGDVPGNIHPSKLMDVGNPG